MTEMNDEVARVLGELATLTELEERDPNAFRVRAYQNAQRAVRSLSDDVTDLSAAQLAAVKGIGRSIAGRIREYVDTGTIGRLEELREKHPASKQRLLEVPGIGPKTVGLLERELGVVDLDGLLAAIDDGRVAQLPGLGEKAAEKLRADIGKLGLTSKARRVPISTALPLAQRIVARLAALDGVDEVAYAGSLRRLREDIGDIDVLVAAADGEAATSSLVDMKDVVGVLGSGGTKTSVITRDGVQVDLRIVPRESFGAALLYFTGSKAHNIRLRQRAIERGWTLSEYALAEAVQEDGEADDGGTNAVAGAVVASRSEQDIYTALDLPWIHPEQREDDGEFEAADSDAEPPHLPVVEDLRGDLHDHTDLSGDGHMTMEQLVAAAVDRGLEYLATTDHAEDLPMTGVGREALLQQRTRLRELEQRRGDIALLHGAELNIGREGGVDYDADFLAGFDWLVASVHSYFDLPVAQQTARVVAAIRNPNVTAIGHLTGRRIGRRAGIDLDVGAVLDAAAETGTAIEINASLARLDAPAEVIREGVRRDVTFVISTDAHAVDELDRAPFGAAQARRGGAPVERIANTWPLERFRSWLDDIRRA